MEAAWSGPGEWDRLTDFYVPIFNLFIHDYTCKSICLSWGPCSSHRLPALHSHGSVNRTEPNGTGSEQTNL